MSPRGCLSLASHDSCLMNSLKDTNTTLDVVKRNRGVGFVLSKWTHKTHDIKQLRFHRASQCAWELRAHRSICVSQGEACLCFMISSDFISEGCLTSRMKVVQSIYKDYSPEILSLSRSLRGPWEPLEAPELLRLLRHKMTGQIFLTQLPRNASGLSLVLCF